MLKVTTKKKACNQYTKDKEKRSRAIHFPKSSNNKKSKRGRWEQKMQTEQDNEKNSNVKSSPISTLNVNRLNSPIKKT